MNDTALIEQAIEMVFQGRKTPAQLLGIAPEIVAGLYAIGLDARKQGRHQQADAIFQRCVLLEPQNPDFLLALAATRQSQARYAEAGEIYQIAALMTEDLSPCAFAALCFARADQPARARVLARHVLDRTDVSEGARWFAQLSVIASDNEVES